MPHPRTAAAALASLALAACAAPSTTSSTAASAPSTEWRVLVKLAAPATDGEAVARHASQVGGVPIRHAAATSAEWHALTLHCADAGECERAVAQLRADTRTFREVQRDERRRAQTAP